VALLAAVLIGLRIALSVLVGADWIRLKKTDRLYEQWLLAKDQESKKPRWSIVRDVLGWR
jgi:hypothetical protein